jgi:NAD(P)-dependent dehydrogenase (short-subunit alcohol dehydrogenase family)
MDYLRPVGADSSRTPLECKANTTMPSQAKPELQQKNGRLQDRVAIVTGSSNGIGQAIALAYAREGALVVVADIGSVYDGQATASTVDQIVREGGQALFHQADVCDAANVDALVAQAVKTYGRLDM